MSEDKATVGRVELGAMGRGLGALDDSAVMRHYELPEPKRS